MAGRPPAVSDYEILRAIEQTIADSGDPVATTTEITERLPIKREGAGQRLNELLEGGVIKRKSVGASYVWWLPEETAAVAGALTGTDQSLEDRLEALFEVGVEWLGLELGAIARVDPEEDRFELEYVSEEYEGFEPGTTLPLSETYCTTAAANRGPASVTDPTEAGIDDRYVHRELGLQTYLGTLIDSGDGHDRTVFFVSTEPRTVPYSETEHTFQSLLGHGVKHVLDRGENTPLQA